MLLLLLFCEICFSELLVPQALFERFGWFNLLGEACDVRCFFPFHAYAVFQSYIGLICVIETLTVSLTDEQAIYIVFRKLWDIIQPIVYTF